MYQVNFTGGYQIEVRGDLCRVTDCGVAKFSGTWAACLDWLRARGARQMG